MRALIAIPLLVILVLFALSNTEPVRIGFWPTDLAMQLPLAVAVLAGMGLAFLVGALFTWVTALGQRRRAHRAEAQVRALGAQVETLKARLAQTAAPSLPPPP